MRRAFSCPRHGGPAAYVISAGSSLPGVIARSQPVALSFPVVSGLFNLSGAYLLWLPAASPSGAQQSRACPPLASIFNSGSGPRVSGKRPARMARWPRAALSQIYCEAGRRLRNFHQ